MGFTITEPPGLCQNKAVHLLPSPEVTGHVKKRKGGSPTICQYQIDDQQAFNLPKSVPRSTALQSPQPSLQPRNVLVVLSK